MSKKPEKTTYQKNAKRRESRRGKALEPMLQTLNREFQKDEASRNPEVIEGSINTLRPHLVATAASYFGGCCWMIDCDPEEAAQDLLLRLPASLGCVRRKGRIVPDFVGGSAIALLFKNAAGASSSRG